MEVKPDTGINIGSNPFYRPSNSTYGSTWMSSGGQNPLKSEDVPLYPDVGDRDLALKNSIRTYKHEALKQMRENGELDSQIYPAIKENMAQIKRLDVIPKQFPAKAEEIKYPEQALKKNLIYQTTNQQYGSKQPVEADMPIKYFPRPECFTETFNGGNYIDTGLNTFKTPSRIHAAFDQ